MKNGIKNIFKRSIALISCIALSVCSISVMATEENEITQENVKSVYYTETMQAMGIIIGDESGNMNFSDNVTRGEFVVMIYRMLMGAGEMPAASKQLFYDVGINHYAAGCIESLTGLGIIKGYPGGIFKPADEISYEEALIVIMRAAGYGKQMEYTDVTAYTLAKRNDVILDEEVSFDTNLTRQQVVELLYKLLYAETVEEIGYGTSGDGYTAGEFIYAVMDMNYKDGVLDGLDGVSFSDAQLDENEVSIDGKIYTTTMTVPTNYLGKSVRYFYEEETENEIIYIFPKDYNSELFLTDDNDFDYVSGTYKYYDENDKEVIAQLNTNNQKIIYNGCAVTESDYYLYMEPSYGNVTLIDNNRDKRYEIVIINEYESMVIDTLDKVNETVRFKNTDENGKMINLNLGELDKYDIIDYSTSLVRNISSLREDTVVTIQKYKTQYAKIYICSDTVSGKIEKSREKDGKQIVTIGDTTYNFSENPYLDGWNYGDCVDVTIYTDINGKIAKVEGSAADVWKVGYAIKAAEVDISSFDKEIQIKLLDSEGNIRILTCNEKLSLDGQDNAINTDVLTALSTPQLIRYKMVKDQVRRIDTAYSQGIFDATEIVDLEDDNTLLKRVAGEIYYKSNINAFKRNYVENGLQLDGEVYMENTNIPVFRVPPLDDGEYEDEDYTVIVASSLSGNNFYEAEAFNTDPENLYIDSIVVYDTSSNLSTSSRLMLIGSVYECVDFEGEQTYGIEGLTAGAKKEYIMNKPEDIQTGDHMLAEGDVIRAAVSNEGEIMNYELLYSYDGAGILNSNSTYIPSGEYGFNSSFRYVLGTVDRISGNLMIFSPQGNGSAKEIHDISKYSVYVYDGSKERSDKVYFGNKGNIADVENYIENYDTVIVGTQNAAAREIIVLK